MGITWPHFTLQPTPDEARRPKLHEGWRLITHYLIVVFERDLLSGEKIGVKGISMHAMFFAAAWRVEYETTIAYNLT